MYSLFIDVIYTRRGVPYQDIFFYFSSRSARLWVSPSLLPNRSESSRSLQLIDNPDVKPKLKNTDL